MKKNAFALIAVGSVFLFGVLLLRQCTDDWCLIFEWQKSARADSFERCASLGFPIMESYPRQCRAGDKLFTENIATAEDSAKDLYVVFPRPNSVVENPIRFSGEARGTWFSEGRFPVSAVDASGVEIGVGVALATSEWMTTDFVPFEGELEFASSSSGAGSIVFKKDNPSGLPENDDSIAISVVFDATLKTSTSTQQ